MVYCKDFLANTNEGNVIDELVLAKFNSITELLLNQGGVYFSEKKYGHPHR